MSGASGARATPKGYDSGLFRLQGSLAAWLPYLFYLAVVPTTIFVSSPSEFAYRNDILLPYWLAAGAALIFLLVVGQWKALFIQRLLDLAFFLGIFVVLSDNIVPLNWGLMDGESELRESVMWSVIQIALALAVFVPWLFIPSRVYRDAGALFVLALLAWQAYLSTQALSAKPLVEAQNTGARSERIAQADLPNIYQIVLDGYSGPAFAALARKTKTAEQMGGFVYYPNASANYVFTHTSGASYLTGKLFRGGAFKPFEMQARTGGLTKILRDEGYIATSYTPDRVKFWSHAEADTTSTSTDFFREDTSKAGLMALLLAVRATPEALRREVHRHTTRTLKQQQPDELRDRYLSLKLIRRFLADEASRPSHGYYHYVHLLMPHAPYVRKGDCSPGSDVDYLEQAECATRVIGEFIATLKALGRYENSLVIIHSDHGIHEDLGLSSAVAPPSPAVTAKFEAVDSFFTAQQTSRRLQALLLVKPIGAAAEPMRVSDLVPQLVDIPATILDDAGLPAIDGDGASVLRAYRNRDIEVFSGFVQQEPERSWFETPGEAIERPVAHATFTTGGEWVVRPDIPTIGGGF